MRGDMVDMVDMAVGIIIGAAFGTIVSSPVDDIVMPPIYLGLFLNKLINFVIVAFAVFLLIKGMNQLKRQEEEAPKEEPAPPRQEVCCEAC